MEYCSLPRPKVRTFPFTQVRARTSNGLAALHTLSCSAHLQVPITCSIFLPSRRTLTPPTPSVPLTRVVVLPLLNVLCEHHQKLDDPSVFDEEVVFSRDHDYCTEPRPIGDHPFHSSPTDSTRPLKLKTSQRRHNSVNNTNTKFVENL
ncbi:hypothetical protein Tco_0493509 [Tanacetum coccineum]